jgi:hypothetical protein
MSVHEKRSSTARLPGQRLAFSLSLGEVKIAAGFPPPPPNDHRP